ncbi:MAG TPA: M23 family metallopeptidase [Longimicrobiales bacterium]
MARRQWTVLFISDSARQIREFRYPRAVVQLASAVVLIIIAGISSLSTVAFMKLGEPLAEHALERENASMKRELTEVRGQITELRSELDVLADHDEKFRLVAGLQPINEDVRRVGIGGSRENKSASNAEVSELLRRARLLNFSWREATGSLASKYARLEATPSIVPTSGYITSAFSRNRQHPILNRSRPHEGVDIAARQGTPIVAAAKGWVRFAGANGDYGLAIEIDHGHGVVTRYAHASKLMVKRGQVVQRGQTIANVGATGLAVGPHVHYEVLVHGRPTNPKNYFFNVKAIAD